MGFDLKRTKSQYVENNLAINKHGKNTKRIQL